MASHNVAELTSVLAEALSRPGEQPAVGAWVNGRIVAVLGSPEIATSSDLAYGLSVLPSGTTTPTHSHRAEEVALILDGSGVITVGEEEHPVARGDLFRTPPHAPHSTRATGAGPLQVLWVYAPAGSEQRWLAENPEES